MDLGEGVAVARVIIYNRNDGDASHASLVSGRLSNSVVSLRNHQGNTLKICRIGDATNVPLFDINFVGESGVLVTNAPTTSNLTASPTTASPNNSPRTSKPTAIPTTSSPTAYSTNSPTLFAPTASPTTAISSGTFFNVISTDFSTVPPFAVLSGDAFVSNGECVLTPNAQGKQGYLLISTLASLSTSFTAQWDYRVFDGNGADGISFNYGPMTSAGGDEKGMVGAFLTVSFIEFEWQGQRVELKYDGTLIQTSAFTLTGSAYRHVVVNVDSSFSVFVSIGGINAISTVLPSTYLSDKANWKFGFAGRTGLLTNKHSIKNLTISAPFGSLGYTYSTYDCPSWPCTQNGTARSRGTSYSPINFDWGTGVVLYSGTSDNVSVKMEGFIKVPGTNSGLTIQVKFKTSADDAGQLIVDENAIIDDWKSKHAIEVYLGALIWWWDKFIL